MITEGVNAYVTLDFANEFHDQQLHNDDWFENYVQEDLIASLISVTRFIDYYEYKGRPVSPTQPLKWPRVGCYVNGGYADSSSVPIQIKYATAQIALDYLRQNVGPGDATSAASTVDGTIQKLKVGPIQIDYAGEGATVASGTDVSFLSDEGYRLLRPFMGANYAGGHAITRV